MSRVIEVNFDGIVGSTHNYAGLSAGNLASMTHRGALSNPREAALQGLSKMKYLADLGLTQAVLPPHARPAIDYLRRVGFCGSDTDVLGAAAKTTPHLLVACYSASNMWVANAATVIPSADAKDQRVHLTPANLTSKLHRSIETKQTEVILRAIFSDDSIFQVHAPVPGGQSMGDEGAANHTRFAVSHAGRGLHLFVYGHRALGKQTTRLKPVRYESRQAIEASQSVARLSQLNETNVIFVQQNPDAIDAGVFHNDVIAVGNENVLLYHEQAFVQTSRVIAELRRRFAEINLGAKLIAIKIRATEITLFEAVKSYLFNSQLVTLSPDHMLLCAPSDCQQRPRVRKWLNNLIASEKTPIREVRYFNLHQSMSNGGGPACLRLRVVLKETELAKILQGVILTESLHTRLVNWVTKHYRDELSATDLADPQLLSESQFALDELTQILGIGSIYPFQR